MRKPGVSQMVARYSGIILLLPSCMLVGYFIGNWADERWGTEPKLALAGVLLGSAAGLFQVFRLLQKP